MHSRRVFFVVFIVTILISISIILLANWAASLGASILTNKGYWLESKVWKSQLLAKVEQPDIVIVGSSRVLNHIDTRQLEAANINAFNYGIGGITLDDFSYSVEKASMVAKSAVLISIPAERLFSTPECPRFWTFSDLKFYMKYAPSCISSMTSQNWLGLLPINAYFFPSSPPALHLPCKSLEGKKLVAEIQAEWRRDICSESRLISWIRGNSSRWVIGYDNGDGEIISREDSDWLDKERFIDLGKRPFNNSSLKFIGGLADIVRRAGKTPILLIEAAPVIHIGIEESLENRVGIKTIYMNNIRFTSDEIADADHVNRKGKEKVSRLLANILACSPDENSSCPN
ncbi:MAG: hypothetical protein ACRECW_15090 [Phyllobacterium sp.]